MSSPQDPAIHGVPRAGPAHALSELSTSDVFAVLWHALADMLGTAAAATLLRRAAKRALPRAAELGGLSIRREHLEYEYTVPASWDARTSPPSRALAELTCELWLLLVDLTGSVVTNRLSQIPELRDGHVLPAPEERS